MRTNSKWLMGFALTGLTLSVTIFAPITAAQAQRQGGGVGRGMGMRGAQTVDPTQSATSTLLSRNDVKSEIMLSQRQSEDIAAAVKTAQDNMQQTLQASRPDRSVLQGLSGDERRQKQQEMRLKQQEAQSAAFAAMNMDLDKKAQEVLKPEQIKRLKELDLQWRGPLALADPKVAEPYKLTAEQKTKITALLGEYRKVQQETMLGIFGGPGGGRGGNRNNGQGAPGAPPADPNAPATPQAAPDPAAMQARIDEAKEKVDKSREEIGAKVVALLTEEQKTAWTQAQGKKFTFRKHDS